MSVRLVCFTLDLDLQVGLTFTRPLDGGIWCLVVGFNSFVFWVLMYSLPWWARVGVDVVYMYMDHTYNNQTYISYKRL